MKKLLLLSLACAALTVGRAQVRASYAALVGTQWHRVSPSHTDVTKDLAFTNDKVVSSVFFRTYKDTIYNRQPFYLSDTVPATFDTTLVAHADSGQYLILYNKKARAMESYRIMQLSQSRMQLFYHAKPSILEGTDNTVVYEAVAPRK